MLEMVTRASCTPGCPNLYWALATVPQPLLEMRSAIQMELDGMDRILPILEHAESDTLDREEWKKL